MTGNMTTQTSNRFGLVPDLSVEVVVAVLLAMVAIAAVILVTTQLAGETAPRSVTLFENMACTLGPLNCG